MKRKLHLMKIFLIGPGGVGKTTVGKLLANDLNYQFIDLDEEFCQKIGNIGDYIKNKGYQQYCLQNSKLFYGLLNEINHNAIITLSSGFLIYNGLSKKHYKTIQQKGISVLLLPSICLSKSADIVIKRQLQRGFGLEADRERIKFIERYHRYKTMGDIKIFSCAGSDKIVNIIKKELYQNKHEKRKIYT